MDKIDFTEFVWIWNKLENLTTPNHQKKMSRWLSNIWFAEDRKALMMAFRNSGKSTIVGLFCAWVLTIKPETRILVMAADYSLAKKMVRNVKRIIEKHPFAKHLVPSKKEQWASDNFMVNRGAELRDPSMIARGLGGNITGSRADLIICDDVEVPKTCDSSIKRADMRAKLSELDYVLVPSGMQLYVGTPHNYYSIYETEEIKDGVEPFLKDFTRLDLPILSGDGQSAWPERFSLERIMAIRRRSGENKFLSQMMLKPVNFSQGRLAVDKLIFYDEKLTLSECNHKYVMQIGDVKMVSASCWWDPSFGKSVKGDDSVVAVVFCDAEGGYWLHDIEYIRVADEDSDKSASIQCAKVAEFVKKYDLPAVHVEKNGIGRFLPGILRQELAKAGISCAVIEETSRQAKDMRIIEAFDAILANRALKVSQAITSSPFVVQMREWQVGGNSKDDAIDAVAGCILSEPVRLIRSADNTFRKDWRYGESYKVNQDFSV